MYWLICVIIFILLYLLDQITKALAYKYFRDGKIKFSKHIVFTYLENKGGFSGFLSIHPIVLLIINIIAIVFFSIFLIPQYVVLRFNFFSVFVSLFLCGACGNLTDRIIRGHVIDFVYFQHKKNSSKVFNLADFYIFIGFIGMIVGAIYYGL